MIFKFTVIAYVFFIKWNKRPNMFTVILFLQQHRHKKTHTQSP